MAASSFVEVLRAFDSHERGILLQWAMGTDFAISSRLRSDLGTALRSDVPERALVAMDYTLDWLYAASRQYVSPDTPLPAPWPADALKASIEDIDLVIAWQDERPRLVLLEAKGFTGWTNKQLLSKVTRLGAIFDEHVRAVIDVHFVLVGPGYSHGIDTTGWPKWLLTEGRYHFLTLPSPGDRYAVQRCLADGSATKTEWTHWKVVKRKWV